MSAPAPSPLTPRAAIVQALRRATPGTRTFFPFPGPNTPSIDREAMRRRVHSAGATVFGPRSYSCQTTEAGVAITRLTQARPPLGQKRTGAAATKARRQTQEVS